MNGAKRPILSLSKGLFWLYAIFRSMYIKVFVTPGAKKELVERTSDTQFEISVREPAERNLANRRVVQLIAREFSLPEGKVRIISGHRSGSKMLSVDV
ncbi:hypothetical protein A2671_00485 [Candidatus Kaiserbacteria bacterium RIFCSPHIGHO2_01_FULL_49_13]|uniref:Uncharacterized protein n=1 Tax=Candidatus Kaiserbacteria bacterium RIFCSPHIGHO2_01_FULL_49_13 TaxID=1798477 RepID=A0A1F6CDD1_9BACT|nr:MAG: hypothetical protein A2671_00485 [Candidatus Kaiserbacteria bacterium RIFCSPHIGHO2_01_FULL_49_13]